MIPIRDEAFNSLEWKPVDGLELEKLIEGMTVIGSEPTDYPLTDGITLYLRAASGRLIALDIGAELYTVGEDENPFYVRIADIPT